MVQIAARLPWWSALFLGALLYLLISVGLGGYLARISHSYPASFADWAVCRHDRSGLAIIG